MTSTRIANKMPTTITDNGANYFSAFEPYAADDMPLEHPEEEEENPKLVVGKSADLQIQLRRERAEAEVEFHPLHRKSNREPKL